MRKLKKSVILGLSIAALGVSTYNVSKTYALENPKSYVAQTNEARSSEVGVKDEDELISALKDPSVQKIILKIT
ncbi:Hypothetical protein RLITU_0771 [Romboutsia lituseburensis]|uniref:hypothetical protein n=1 Tax=Romboutsia lituseburensis TaxID=1537 RepID=UPI000E130CB9|nr:hypothetical protein [Romboutsia lituseburensis]CEH33375.1 Hypothetical protein RLITU_0771 [Romboutsia lituseburensis]